ncbi:MAG: hypothetical protein ABH831_02365 [Candidatus Nealsonbacteria bacterium]
MDKPLVYIIWAIFFIFLTWFRVRKFSLHKKEFKNLTPEFFAEKRARTPLSEYTKWLRRWYTDLSAQALEHKERGSQAPKYLVDSLRLIENEMESIGKQTGESLLHGKKTSEDIQQ